MKELHDWFFQNKRSFPWRDHPTPYRVWISEVMLQQTRAAVVIPYFEKWMEAFPDISHLADASIEQVIKNWEGLGYYSRARNLHAAARQILDNFGGELPQTYEELKTIRGLGPYTIGAILSFGFHRRSAAVDGNVVRVLSRYSLIEKDVSKAKTRKEITELAGRLLDCEEPWVTTEALIELGALVCLPKPRCDSCPLEKTCLARHAGKELYLPIKSKDSQTIQLHRTVCLIEYDEQILLKKGEKGKVMADLYELPYFETKNRRSVVQNLGREFQSKLEWIAELSVVKHSFTRYLVHLYPVHLKTDVPFCMKGFQWIPQKELKNLPFSSGHRKILKQAVFFNRLH